jgi:hypothetical protein
MTSSHFLGTCGHDAVHKNIATVIGARASREAEILVLRQQVLVLNRRSPARLRLQNIDRLKLVWLYRLFPSLLDAMSSSSRRPLPTETWDAIRASFSGM